MDTLNREVIKQRLRDVELYDLRLLSASLHNLMDYRDELISMPEFEVRVEIKNPNYPILACFPAQDEVEQMYETQEYKRKFHEQYQGKLYVEAEAAIEGLAEQIIKILDNDVSGT